ncbi:NADH-quinone oxidoreductase subunit NuoK [bacterium]|nr:NADH-quinone oxidoreductase subunit NuoK [bacterium]
MLNNIFNIGLFHYLILAMVLFFIGAFGVIISKNIIKILICLEFMLTAVNINFIAFAAFVDSVKVNGFIFSIFYTAIGAVEIAVALVIFYLMYREKKSINIENYKELNG